MKPDVKFFADSRRIEASTRSSLQIARYVHVKRPPRGAEREGTRQRHWRAVHSNVWLGCILSEGRVVNRNREECCSQP